MNKRSGSCKLWCNVVIQIAKDASAIKRAAEKLQNKEITFEEFTKTRLQGHAIYPIFIEFFIENYLSPHNKSLQIICEYASMDIDYIIERTSQMFKHINIESIVDEAIKHNQFKAF